MIEESVLKEIGCLSQGCREKENAVIEEMKKLKKYVDEYLDKNEIRKDVKRLGEVIDVLPDCIIRSHLEGCQYNLLMNVKGQKTIQGVQTGDQKATVTGNSKEMDRLGLCNTSCRLKKTDAKALKEIECLGRSLKERVQESYLEQEKLQKLVTKYLDANGMCKDTKRLEEWIDILPAGIVRIRLRERCYGILKEKAQNPLQEEAKEIQKCVDESPQSDSIQITGMGGIQ